MATGFQYVEVPAAVRTAGEKLIETAAPKAAKTLLDLASIGGQVVLFLALALAGVGLVLCWQTPLRRRLVGSGLLALALLGFAAVLPGGGLHLHPFWGEDGPLPLHLLWGFLVAAGVVATETWFLGKSRKDDFVLLLFLVFFFLVVMGIQALFQSWALSPLWWLFALFWASGWNEAIQGSDAYKTASTFGRLLYQLPGAILVIMTC